MFIYQGKFDWPEYADNETFTIIFPNGVVRANDPVYLFTQWTKDSHRVRKSKFFQTIVVSDVKQLSNTTDVSFNLSGSWYSYAITTEQNYAKIKVNMSSPGGQKAIALDRVWKPQGKVDHAAALRIWAGSITVHDNAIDEQAIFVLPEDYKDGKPVISSWQWTKDTAGKAKTTAFKGTPMNFVSSDDKISKFAFNNVYDFTCSWNRKTEKLGLEIKKDGKQTRVGELNLVAKIEPKAHSFDSDDLVPPTKKETEFRLPQPQTTLPRVLDPMPFPKTLLETLTQGAAFIEQAGYLTVQAQNKFAALDVDFHKQTVLVETLKKDKKNLESEITSLTGQRNKANATINELKNQLAKASEEYQKKVKQLNDRIEHLKQDDRFDHKVISKLQQDLNKLLQDIAILNDELSKAQCEKEELNEIILTLQGEIISLVAQVLELENALKVQKKENIRLLNENGELDQKLQESLIANKALQSQLANAEADHERTKKERDDALTTITSTKKELDETKALLETKLAVLKETSEELAKHKVDLATAQKQVRDRDREAKTFDTRIKNWESKFQSRNDGWSKLVDEYQEKCYAGQTSEAELEELANRVEDFRVLV
ncbi:hypothetical protein RAB80_011396 [Fusarium oxysporum f. sp. vasinfectum]|uniref:Uncharacterized protein n=1 Tax=Fusarium oxysporum f. sp. vasinfectum 25433 TaxID=1089449 RepID=X0KWJ0_FUSOX|nr:hypothetical protein FOTG_18485 [Fusarium oxysporum f. sp. vasinfectum 25433]KAK2673853.1 hypothetical protein RAB80_011396 [Fusarium oxysporum f. sp. vasinfectum]KAK2691420.1 hypothetical protein QWA68_008898 [Fusarium oxysporum]KAK2930268.1 hypothetical protein FoTM2_010609 [Fusarium oxysporum f. sp. vasinfectum]